LDEPCFYECGPCNARWSEWFSARWREQVGRSWWGEDVVSIRDAIFGRKVTLESGLDDDTLHLLGVNLFNKGLEEDFEQALQP
jgi:hypothetical protein